MWRRLPACRCHLTGKMPAPHGSRFALGCWCYLLCRLNRPVQPGKIAATRHAPSPSSPPFLTRRSRTSLGCLALLVAFAAVDSAADEPKLTLKKGDHVV